MGQITISPAVSILLTSVDRLTAANAANGMNPAASHIIALGANAADNIDANTSYLIALGVSAGSGVANAQRIVAIGQGTAKNSTVSDLIAIGDSAMDAGVTNANAAGTIALGSNALGAWTLLPTATQGPMVVIGYNAAKLLQRGSTSVVIGAGALPDMVGDDSNPTRLSVIIGHDAARFYDKTTGTLPGIQTSVLIGYNVGSGSVTGRARGCASNVIIGSDAGSALPTVDGSISGNVWVGYQAGMGFDSASGTGANVFIGVSNSTNSNAQSCVSVGGGTRVITGARHVTLGQGSTISQGNDTMLLGQGIACTGVSLSNSIIIGNGAVNNNAASPTVGHIVIGYAAGTSAGNGLNASHQFLVETIISGTKRTILYGDMANGVVVIGNTVNANRTLRGTTQPTQALALINGTVGAGTNPASGGYFYVSAGVLHWFDQGGRDMSISVPTAGQMASTTTGYTDGAAAAVGTLNNAPTAGDPTKWIPVNDNGTVRYIPAW